MTNYEKPVWLKMKEPELKKVITSLAEKNSPSKIGLILRDQYGVPTTRVFGKKLKAYLKELDVDSNEDLENAEKKVDILKEHLKTNITDKHAKHTLQEAQARLNITRRYFGIVKRRKK